MFALNAVFKEIHTHFHCKHLIWNMLECKIHHEMKTLDIMNILHIGKINLGTL